ncbi:MAG TPA: NAD-dependent succinate-semialdehyde dehydrogenase [Blastocatellia bacterium]|nr:NAD-dependent succinate-semialdehyde dehydrogenase [Blastocatellia bacterium]
MKIATINPHTGETLRKFRPLSAGQLEEKIDLAAEAFRQYRRTTFAERSRMMCQAAEILEAEKEKYGRLMTTEMGKPLRAAIEEAAKCAWACRYYAEHAERLLADEVIETNATRSYIRYQPIGAILAVMPWNFPFWQVFRFAVPSMMAGNVVLLKHASNVPQCALAIEELFQRAGFPAGVFQTLLISSVQVPQVLVDPRVAAVTLTGSGTAGRAVASEAGKQVKKTVLELGGSDPFIVLPSADLEQAVETAVRARVVNNGQSCIAAKRFIVVDAIADQFESLFVEGMSALKVGDPMDETVEVGPLATAEILDELDEQVQKSVDVGAQILIGGHPLNVPGYYYAPTVLTHIPVEAPAYHEELFGPVAMLFRVRDLDHAIRLANDSTFGLGASAWTRDPSEQERLVDEIEAGMVFINGMVASDPRIPFGGIKQSGYGRELSANGIREFVNIKTIWIRDE